MYVSEVLFTQNTASITQILGLGSNNNCGLRLRKGKIFPLETCKGGVFASDVDIAGCMAQFADRKYPSFMKKR